MNNWCSMFKGINGYLFLLNGIMQIQWNAMNYEYSQANVKEWLAKKKTTKIFQ